MTIALGRAATGGALALSIACASPDLQPEGGSWYTGHAGSTHTGLARIDLYHVDGNGARSRVDADVLITRFYPPDCIVYEPGRDAGGLHVACGEHEPVQVAFHAPWRMSGGYEATDEGLRATSGMRVVNDRVIADVALVPLAEIVRAGQSAPVRRAGWQPPTDESASAVEPTFSQVEVDPASRDGRAWTPLMHAVRDTQTAVIDALLRAGADPDARDAGGTTALHLAVGDMWPDTAIIRRLLDAGADTEVTAVLGMTPLLVGALGRKTDVVRMLLDHGANPCVRDRQGETIVSLAGDHAELRPLAAQAYQRCERTRAP